MEDIIRLSSRRYEGGRVGKDNKEAGYRGGNYVISHQCPEGGLGWEIKSSSGGQVARYTL